MSIDRSAIEKEVRPHGGRYFYRFADGSQAEMDFSEDAPGIVTITHTGTPRQHRGQGVAAQLVARAVADFRTEGRKVVPLCWFARQQFDAHPDWADLLGR